MTREEALRIVRKYNYVPEERAALETLIPELNESEDERIRKNIIGYIQERIDEFPGDVRLVKRWKKEIAWLESLPERFALSIKQEWDGFDEDCLKRAIWYVENPAPSVIKDFRLALWLNTLRSRFSLKPQPKAEWSEEDEEMIQGCINSVEYELLDNGMNDEVKTDPRIAWLKSLRPQKLDASKFENFDPVDVLNRIKTEWPMAWEKVVGKQEWSEEDEKMLSKIIKHFDWYDSDRFNAEDCKEAQDFLKSLRPQPKQEWSDRDKEILEFVLGLLDNLVWRRDWEISQAECLEWLVKSLNPTKKEWSEDDEKMRINILNALTPQLVYSSGKGTCTGTSMYKYNDEIKWLKFLPERFNLQPKNEWDTYDKAIVNCIVCCINGQFVSEAARKQAIEWFNKHRIDFLNSSSWKPSEEQMKWSVAPMREVDE